MKRKLALRAAQKKEWVSYRGGQCVTCGYDRCVQALVFHHVNPALKRFSISGGGDSRYDISQGSAGHTKTEILEELDRCVVLCGNCHGELHAGLWNIDELLTEAKTT
jgi:5-methylcytosine-specific restriction endonuclease McrA